MNKLEDLIKLLNEIADRQTEIIKKKHELEAEYFELDKQKGELLKETADEVGGHICTKYFVFKEGTDDKNRKFNAVKEVKSALGLGLKEALDWVDNWMEEHNITI